MLIICIYLYVYSCKYVLRLNKDAEEKKTLKFHSVYSFDRAKINDENMRRTR